MTRQSLEHALRGTLLATASFAGCGELWAGETESLRAVFSQVQGPVTLTLPPNDTGVRIARLLQVIPGGAVITVPTEAAAGLICSTHRHIFLEAGSEWSLTHDACARGRELSPDSYHLLAPRAGRKHLVGKLIAVARDSRSRGWDPRIPVLLSPRNSAVTGGRPVLLWTTVDSATEYEIELLGHRGSFVERLAADDVDCAPDPEAWGEVSVCETPYPASRPELAAGETYFLNVGAREGIASPLYKTLNGEQIHRLESERADTVSGKVASQRSLPLSEAARWLLVAETFAEHDLFSDAASAYRQALTIEPSAAISVRLGDALLLTGLADFAAMTYQAASRADSEPAVAAAIAFGLGQSHIVLRQYGEAFDHFQQAHNGYGQLGLDEEAAAAEQQAAKAGARLER